MPFVWYTVIEICVYDKSAFRAMQCEGDYYYKCSKLHRTPFLYLRMAKRACVVHLANWLETDNMVAITLFSYYYYILYIIINNDDVIIYYFFTKLFLLSHFFIITIIIIITILAHHHIFLIFPLSSYHYYYFYFILLLPLLTMSYLFFSSILYNVKNVL